jgi:hypothetical protein
MASLLRNYAFNRTARTITFSDHSSVLLQDIGEIVNVTRNIVIYDPLDVAKGSASLVNNVLTLFFDTSLQADTDVLRIVYGDSYAQKITVGSGGGGGGGGGGLTNSELRSSPVAVTIGALSTGANAIGSITNTIFAATQSGTWNLTNITGTVSLPTLAATSTLQSALNALLPASLGSKVSAASLSITPANDAAFMLGAVTSVSSVYRTSITAPDIATPTVGILTTAAGGSLTAVAHQVRVTAVNAFGRSLPVIPAGNGIVATASGVIRIPITPNGLDFDIFLSTVADPLYLGRVTAAEVTSGVIITAAATATTNCIKTTTGATAGVVECRVVGTQRAASTDIIPFSFVMPATPISCVGKQFVDIDVEVTLTASPVLPVIVVVPFFLNSTDIYVQSDIVSTLNLSVGTSNRTRLRYQVQGNTGVHLVVQSIVGVGASINMWSSVS